MNNRQNLTYGYDPAGNLTSITDSIFTASRIFNYDDVSRLGAASGTFGANQSQSSCTYAYNAIGNLTDKCGATFTYGDPMHPSAVTFNPATGRNYTYDANGNMTARGTQTLTWDIDNRVTSVSILGGGITSMQYDYTGMRVKKDAPTGMTLFPFKGYEIAPDGTITKFIRIGIETFASKKRTTSGATTQLFYHNDHLGGVNVISTESGAKCQLNEYDPWGGESRSEGPTPGTPASCDPTHRFTGQELDPESGLYYYGGRYYDQEISRFISPDPYVQEPDDPQNLNRYSYVLNNPQGYTDPTGHFFGLDDLIAAIVLAVEAISTAVSAVATAATSAIGQVTGSTAVLAAGADALVKGSALTQALSAVAACVECGAATMVQLETNVIAAAQAFSAAQATYAAAQAAYQTKWIATGVLVVGSLSEGMAAGIARAPGVPKIDKYMKDVQSGKGNYETSSASIAARDVKSTWGKPQTLTDHFQRHGKDFGAANEGDYARRASQFLQRAIQGRLPGKMAPDGTIRFYDPKSDTLGAYNPDGTTKTFFKPDPVKHKFSTNLDYWNSQQHNPGVPIQ